MAKTYKVSYKTYLNDRLKEVFFHGKSTYPLYVQVTFDRKTIFFKSYYFELFSKPRYAIFMDGIHGPSIDDIIKKENELIDYVIDKTIDNFSLDKFKKEYTYYSIDLCDIMEDGFIDYLFTFFQDKGMPNFATTVQQGIKYRIVYEVVRDFKRAFNKPLYDELVENSFFYAPPYFPIYDFMKEIKKWPMLSLSVMEWEDLKIQLRFITYFQKTYPKHDIQNTFSQVNKLLDHLRKSPI